MLSLVDCQQTRSVGVQTTINVLTTAEGVPREITKRSNGSKRDMSEPMAVVSGKVPVTLGLARRCDCLLLLVLDLVAAHAL